MKDEKIEYFNFYYFNTKIEKTYLPKRSLAKNLFLFFIKLGRDFLFDITHFRFFISLKDRVVFYCVSENDLLAIKNIYQNISQQKIIVNNPPRNTSEGVAFPRFIPSLITFFYLPAFIAYYLRIGKEKREMVNYSRNDVLLTYGYYVYFRYLIKKSTPAALIFSNDHLFDIRILIHFANKAGIKSFYIQHASVTENFPKLEMTHALLEGEDAKEKYLTIGSDPEKISLIGMIKYDQFVKHINKNDKISTIGFAINATEDESKLCEDINFLVQNLPDIKIILRPHPIQYTYMMKSRLEKIFDSISFTENLSLSDPRSQKAFDFLSEVDLLICGDSSIHLEAVLINVLCIYYDTWGKYPDHYGYLKKGLAFKAKNVEEILALIQQYKSKKPYVRDKAKPYMDTLNTPFEGKSTELALKIIQEKLSS